MNTGQMMLTMGAMMLLSFLVLRFNSIHLTSAQSSYNAKFGIVATSLATSLMEEAKDKVFDEVVLDTTKSISSPNDLSNKLGPDGSEVYPNFNDFDDYNNLFYVDSLSLKNPQTGAPSKFEIRAKVVYVSDANPDATSGSRTYHKKMTVSVFSNSMIDTVKLSTVFSYWHLLD
jgi:MSHA pilin protein MshD